MSPNPNQEAVDAVETAIYARGDIHPQGIDMRLVTTADARAVVKAVAPAIRKHERERLREELAEEFEKRAQIEAEKRARVKKDEAKDRASGKLAKVDSYEATWNYHEGLSCAYQRAASHIRAMLAALGDDPK